MKPRIVVDTNVYVSRLINPFSVSGRAVQKSWEEGTTLLSSPTFAELRAVLMRKKLAPYIQPGSVGPYLAQVWGLAEEVVALFPIHASRDPKDDEFLEVAVHGQADLIVTGDADLLALNSFRGVAILTPTAFLERG